MKIHKLAALTAAGVLWSLNASAQFSYNNSDLLLGFRTPGGTSDLLVDIGSVSLYTGATTPITISGNYYTSSQLTDAGLNLNNLYFAVFGDVSPGYPATYGPYNTLWVAQTSTQLGFSRSRIESIGAGGNFLGATTSPGADNTATAIVTSDSFSQSGDNSYAAGMGPNGNFQGNFGSNNNIENNTPLSFTSGSIISDLYEMRPNQDGLLLGQFVLTSDGALTFNPVPEPTTWATLGLGLLGLAGWRRILCK